ncbi:MAG TPA: hypothetical protein VL171_07600 [Verrucomicrobiae bacterium]|nr:hypothetical protein [Verrucomicrobiae bacterium]
MATARKVYPKLRFVLFDWGDTLMSEAGPVDIPMADWPEGARNSLRHRIHR